MWTFLYLETKSQFKFYPGNNGNSYSRSVQLNPYNYKI